MSFSFDMSLDGGVVPLDEDALDDGVLLGLLIELLLELDDGVDAVPVLDELEVSDEVDGLVVDGVVLLELLDDGEVLGDMVDELELDDGGVVVEGVVVVDDVLLVSRWQPAAPIASAMATMAQGFRFM